MVYCYSIGCYSKVKTISASGEHYNQKSIHRAKTSVKSESVIQ